MDVDYESARFCAHNMELARGCVLIFRSNTFFPNMSYVASVMILKQRHLLLVQAWDVKPF